MAYKIFTRTWYRRNPDYFNGLEPHAGRKYTIDSADTYEEARAICKAWNASHKPGKLSRKAEFTEA